VFGPIKIIKAIVFLPAFGFFLTRKQENKKTREQEKEKQKRGFVKNFGLFFGRKII
jgi:hypothetical protein